MDKSTVYLYLFIFITLLKKFIFLTNFVLKFFIENTYKFCYKKIVGNCC